MVRTGPIRFREVWLVDFEFSAPSGERPRPICLVAWELISGRKVRLWEDDLNRLDTPPYPIDSNSLFVAFYASAEITCHLALGWPAPARVLDLFTEFRNLTNGKETPCGSGLLGALTWFGLDGIEVAEKEDMRKLALRGGPWTNAERAALLDYCESDVTALAKLLPRMLPEIDVLRAALRGRYMIAAARMEHSGIPIDAEALATLRDNWSEVQNRLIERIDGDFQVFDGRTFKACRWAEYLAANKIPWPRLPSGALALDDETFRLMAHLYPSIAPIRELRDLLSQMRLADLAVGSDSRNRCLLSAFRARTSRNQPSNSKFIFGAASWLRGLIKPNPGTGLAYIDWCQQEFGIAAALSGDPKMIEAYESGDPYLAFAKQSTAIPPDGTQETHGSIRELFKACALAVQYGMEAESLALRIGQPVPQARELLRRHRETYREFWGWSDAAVNHAMLLGKLYTVFDWTIHVGRQANPRSLRNFPMQANGAEMLRLACCYATERGIRICAPVHDAILIEAPLNQLEATVEAAQQAMAEASGVVLDGLRLRSEARPIRYPDRYEDERGKRMWATVWEIINKLSETGTCAATHMSPVRRCNNTCAPVHTRPILSISPLMES